MQTSWTRLALAAALAAALSGRSGAQDSNIKVKEGDKAPPIALEAAQIEKALPGATGKTLNLKDLQGKKNVVLFFYPKAMTPGCTIESCGFRDKAEDFAKLDTVVIGISTDKLEDQQKFIDKEKLNFPLLADPEQNVSKALGVMVEGRPVTQRVTFVIDKTGTIRKIYPKVDARAHHEVDVLDYVKQNLK